MERAQVTSPYRTGWPDRLQPCIIQAGQRRGPESLPYTALVDRIDYNPVSYRLANGVGPWHFPVLYRLADGEGLSHFPVPHWLAG